MCTYCTLSTCTSLAPPTSTCTNIKLMLYMELCLLYCMVKAYSVPRLLCEQQRMAAMHGRASPTCTSTSMSPFALTPCNNMRSVSPQLSIRRATNGETDRAVACTITTHYSDRAPNGHRASSSILKTSGKELGLSVAWRFYELVRKWHHI